MIADQNSMSSSIQLPYDQKHQLYKKAASVMSERQYIKLHANQNLIPRSKRRGSDLEILATHRS